MFLKRAVAEGHHGPKAHARPKAASACPEGVRIHISQPGSTSVSQAKHQSARLNISQAGFHSEKESFKFPRGPTAPRTAPPTDPDRPSKRPPTVPDRATDRPRAPQRSPTVPPTDPLG